jgi:GntR family transcriptional regulator, transcriptional repressor for pyruvate dehydrogenase complex
MGEGRQSAAYFERTGRVVAWLSARMQTGALRPGDPLPSEAELTEAAKVGKGHVRAAISCLCTLGILHWRGDSAVVVAEGPHLPVLLALVAALYASRPQEAREAWCFLAAHLAWLSAQRATQADHTAMAEELAGMYAATAAGDHIDHAVRFHRTIARSAGNSILAAFAEALLMSGVPDSRSALEADGGLHESARVHGEIYRAVRRHRPAEARKAMEEHLRLVAETAQCRPCPVEPEILRGTGA